MQLQFEWREGKYSVDIEIILNEVSGTEIR